MILSHFVSSLLLGENFHVLLEDKTEIRRWFRDISSHEICLQLLTIAEKQPATNNNNWFFLTILCVGSVFPLLVLPEFVQRVALTWRADWAEWSNMASLSCLAIDTGCRQRHPLLLPQGPLSPARLDGLPSVAKSGQWSRGQKQKMQSLLTPKL